MTGEYLIFEFFEILIINVSRIYYFYNKIEKRDLSRVERATGSQFVWIGWLVLLHTHNITYYTPQ